MITETQDLILKLIEKNSFNNFSGPSVVRDLRAHQELWQSVLMTQFVRPLYQKLENPITSAPRPPVAIYHEANISALKGIPKDSYDADTLIIHCEPKQQDSLEALSKQWKADTSYWIAADEAYRAMGTTWRLFKTPFTREDRVLLVLWWD